MPMELYSANPPKPPPGPYPTCECFERAGKRSQPVPPLHEEVQDTTCDAWQHLMARIDAAARNGSVDFTPLEGMSGADRARVITLPPTIGQLTRVRTLNLYGSHL